MDIKNPQQQKLIKLPKVETEEQKLDSYHGFELKTKNGYRLDAVTSALQKSIRRGQEERACFWAYEMFESGFVRYFWRRMSIIVIEDIGVADPFAAVLVNSLAQSSERVNKKDKVEVLHPGMAVMYLCRAKKAREVDYLLEIVENKRNLGQKLEVEIHELDCHTDQGRQRLRKEAKERGIPYERLIDLEFYYQGVLLNNPIPDIKWKKKVWEMRKLDKRKLKANFNGSE